MASRKTKKRDPFYMPRLDPPKGWKPEGESLIFYGDRLRIDVHRHIYGPGKWFVSCREISIAVHELQASTIEEATKEALGIVSTELQRMNVDLAEAQKVLKE